MSSVTTPLGWNMFAWSAAASSPGKLRLLIRQHASGRCIPELASAPVDGAHAIRDLQPCVKGRRDSRAQR